MNSETSLNTPETMIFLESSNRKNYTDYIFRSSSPKKASFVNSLFLRVAAKKIVFDEVDFSYSIFDICYFRECSFVRCNFTGCRFSGSNLYKSHFDGCKFDYAVFERTLIEPEILDVGCPSFENLKLKFARSLRTNYQSLGDAESVNKAIKVELEATREHLKKAWKSTEAYYREKYKKWSRFKMFVKWLNFSIWDYVWGNGESLVRLGIAFLIVLFVMAIGDVFIIHKNALLLTSYYESFLHVPVVFFGIKTIDKYPEFYLSIILLVRLVMMGLLLSIIIKRFSRR